MKQGGIDMSKGNSGLFPSRNKFSNKQEWSDELEEGKQGKHIKRHKNCVSSKSSLTISMKEAGKLVKKYSGKGDVVGNIATSNKERVDFGKIIGQYTDEKGTKHNTTMGLIHHSKNGVHIVPSKPKE